MYVSQLTNTHRGRTVPQSFHLFSQLPPEIRDDIWHYAYASETPNPGVHFFEVCKTPRTGLCFHLKKAAARPTRELCTVASYKGTWAVEGRPRATEELSLSPMSTGYANDKGFYANRGVSSYRGNQGILNACRESREAALWWAEFLQGNSHLALLITSPKTGAAPSCITIDVAQDLICLLPHWVGCLAWEGDEYSFSLLKSLRVKGTGHAVTRLAMQWDPFMYTGTMSEYSGMSLHHRRKTFHPFLVQLLAHLKRETFVEADYPRTEKDEGDFEVNRPFNGHSEFKGKFYLIDESIALKDPSKLQDLERCRKPEFVCGGRKYFKVEENDKFFVYQPVERVLDTLKDLERAVLRHEYGDLPADMPFWGVYNPMVNFKGTIGCSLYALAVVNSRT